MRIASFALTGALALCVSGVLAVAADSAPAVEKAPAKVQDLVKAIATTKKMDPKEVESFFRKGGLDFDLNSELRGEVAASMLQRLGFNISSSSDMLMSSSDVSRMAMVASYGRFSASSEDQVDGGGDPQDDEANNRGRKTRAGGNSPNSNANVNAFFSISDDPRD